MKLVDMKLPKKSKKERFAEMPKMSAEDEPRYPYGLELRFERDSIKKLSILKSLEHKDRVAVTATGFVQSINVADDGKTIQGMTIQLQKIALSPGAGHSQKVLDKIAKIE